MPKEKDLKRAVRARMNKTGESYTAARAQLLEKNHPIPGNAAELAGMSDAAVRQKTGRTWKQWVQVLDGHDATKLAHREIAELVSTEYGVPGWWTQTVTVGYERIRGLRDKGQRRGGGYEASKSKVLAVPIARVYRAWKNEAERDGWLPPATYQLKSATPGKAIRFTWSDGSIAEARFTARTAKKSQVAVQHRNLATKAAGEAMKQYWGEALVALAERLR
jgi:uncharacterized protein YndB with AHSA1/START domain